MEDNMFAKLDQMEESEVDAGAWLQEFSRVFRQLSPELRAYTIIKSFMNTENPTYSQYRLFISWLTDINDAKAKNIALERVINEESNQHNILL